MPFDSQSIKVLKQQIRNHIFSDCSIINFWWCIEDVNQYPTMFIYKQVSIAKCLLGVLHILMQIKLLKCTESMS